MPFRTLVACAFALLLAGCLPESVHPVTAPAEALDAPELLGLWRSDMDDSVLYVHVLRGNDRELEIAVVSHESDGAGNADFYIGHVSQAGPRRYINLRRADAAPGEAPPYWIFGYEPGEDRGVTLLFLSEAALARAIGEGRLAGQVASDGTARLTASGEAIAGYLEETAAKELFGRTFDLEPVPTAPAAP